MAAETQTRTHEVRSVPDTIPAVNCALVSDLHLGILSGVDVARDPSVRERLVEAVSGADHVVLVGDVLEMRERRLVDLLEIARPLFDALGEVTAGEAAHDRARQPRSRPRRPLARPPAARRHARWRPRACGPWSRGTACSAGWPRACPTLT